ncbi:MAG TPA: alkaline phosphatase [Hyphomicrobiaceae bacterium]|nr:alkaline phosphatase [Hyphomicrobiaceae bacterium]
MIRSRRLLLWLGLWAATPAMAQAIYPVNRAEILVGAKFDFKVELQGKVAPDDIKVTINGRDAAAIFSTKPQIDAGEEGLGHTAYWLRDVYLSAAGPYEVTAAAGNVSQTVRWEAFGTPERRARNVILFIGDGLSLAHRTAARVLSKGLVEGRYGAQLAIDDMPHMALVSTSGTDAIVTDSANSMSAYATGHKSCVTQWASIAHATRAGLRILRWKPLPN